MYKLTTLFFVLIAGFSNAQTFNEYEISFENAVHHEANVALLFKDLENDVLEVSMSRSSPGRYAIHEFAKNVYNVKAFDSKGKVLSVTRPNPYQWNVSGHDGTVKFTYTIFGDQGDGTYFQIDETHAHLNMPAAFAFARSLDYRPIKIKFNVRKDLKWKVATQLKYEQGTTYMAPNLQYFMDSPVEISNFMLREFGTESNGKKYVIRLALHHQGSEAVADQFLKGVEKIVEQEQHAMGGLPDYDYDTYTFLACYMPQASGDGMEHRNSTYVVGSFPLEGPGLMRALGTVAHEFFHCWNVERIRPASLEPFNFERANMSGDLWFAEGFTNYYTRLFLCRAGLITQKDYADGLDRAINVVKNSPGRTFFNPIEMSYQAPFADAATSIDPTNMSNTFISYYTYGEVIGLALDLSLRSWSGLSTLDGFMQNVWNKHGKTESPYTVRDLKTALSEYVSSEFATSFFDQYIFKSGLPDFGKLLSPVGVSYGPAKPGKSYIGASFEETADGVVVDAYPGQGTPAYSAGLEKGDQIVSVEGKSVTNVSGLHAVINQLSPGKDIIVAFRRRSEERQCRMLLGEDPEMKCGLYEESDQKRDGEKVKQRAAWLGAK